MRKLEATQAHVDMLVRLQKIESETARLEKKLVGVESQAETQCKKLNELGRDLESASTALQSEKKRYSTIEEEVYELTTRITKSQESLRVVANNREYQVLKREVDDNTKRVSELEEELIIMMDELETLEKRVAVCTSLHGEEQGRIESVVNEIKNSTTEERHEIESMATERAEISGKIPADLYEHYSKLIVTSDRLAVVKVVDGVCYGCFMKIPPQQFIDMQKNGGFHHCPRCHRVLFHEA